MGFIGRNFSESEDDDGEDMEKWDFTKAHTEFTSGEFQKKGFNSFEEFVDFVISLSVDKEETDKDIRR